ncbi:MAG: hypothetical protein ACFFF4_06185 [Candidatus Thorarchaeota archaeon]
MSHCELWLEIKNHEKSFRVALLVPDDTEVPSGYERCEGYNDPSEKKLYVTEWFVGIKPAKDKMDATAQFYTDNNVRFLFFREIRKPKC